MALIAGRGPRLGPNGCQGCSTRLRPTAFLYLYRSMSRPLLVSLLNEPACWSGNAAVRTGEPMVYSVVCGPIGGRAAWLVALQLLVPGWVAVDVPENASRACVRLRNEGRSTREKKGQHASATCEYQIVRRQAAARRNVQARVWPWHAIAAAARTERSCGAQCRRSHAFMARIGREAASSGACP